MRSARERCRAWTGTTWSASVTCAAPYDWNEGTWTLEGGYAHADRAAATRFVVAYDFGIKRNILRNLVRAGCRVRVVPADDAGRRRAGA